VQKKFSIVFSPAAQKDIAALETDEAIQLTKDIASYLEINPFPFGKTRIKKLTGYKPSLYRCGAAISAPIIASCPAWSSFSPLPNEKTAPSC
jgi:hypothetical protein